MNDKRTLYLVGGGVLLIYFGVLNPILQALGIKSTADERELDSAAQDPGSAWSPTMWQKVPGAVVITESAAQQMVQDIYNAFGGFNDCEECVKSVFRKLSYKTQVSYLSYKFSLRYGMDLLSFLRGGNWPQDRLSESDVSEINSFIQKLPLK